MKVGADPEVYVHTDTWYYGPRYAGVLPAAIVFNMANDTGFEYNDNCNSNPAYVTNDGKLIVDGISLELNPVASDAKILVSNIQGLLRLTSRIINHINENTEDRYDVFIRPVAPLQLDMLKEWGDPRLSMFGCDPDAIIYGERDINPAHINARRHPWRYFGGHVHIEWKDPQKFFADPDNLYRVIYTCDCTLGPASVLLDQVVSTDAARRRRVYGQPSAHRPQQWGIEYRYPTNSWLLSYDRALLFFTIAQCVPDLVDVINAEFATDEVGIRTMLISGDAHEAQATLERVMSSAANDALTDIINELITISQYSVRNWRYEWFR